MIFILIVAIAYTVVALGILFIGTAAQSLGSFQDDKGEMAKLLLFSVFWPLGIGYYMLMHALGKHI
jgi:hypothetical protein